MMGTVEGRIYVEFMDKVVGVTYLPYIRGRGVNIPYALRHENGNPTFHSVFVEFVFLSCGSIALKAKNLLDLEMLDHKYGVAV
jgi:hypothetical protein